MNRKLWFDVVVVTIIAFAVGCESENSQALDGQVEEEKVIKETGRMEQKTTQVKLETTMGDIVIELDEKAAPVTVKNFLQYVQEGFFDGVIFHRVIDGFMIQGGGFTADMRQKPTKPPIVNEASNGLKNGRGTIAMARTNNPNSATSQFFINHKDNDFLNYIEGRNPGYAVFGRVVEGMETVDKIAAVKTGRKGPHGDVPVEPVVIKKSEVVSGG